MKARGDSHAVADEVRFPMPIMIIQAPEGTMAASPGDWIIGGAQGGFYPCKPDIAGATREPAETTNH
jgi:hypothetical protein